MKLLYTPTSPYSRKVRVVAAELGIELDLEHSDPHDPASAVARTNPLGKVPTLLLDDGSAVYDSPVICELLDGLHGSPRLHGHDPASRLGALRLQALADGVMDAAVAALLESRRPADKRIEPVRQMDKVRRGIAALAAELRLLEGELSVGVIAAACALAYLDLRHPRVDWRAAEPGLNAWHARFSPRPSMAATAHPTG